jgi:hypothetical protein
VLVVANGSARRGEKAPGHLDVRSFAFDEGIGNALRTGDAGALGAIDEALSKELLAAGLAGLKTLSGLSGVEAKTWYDADPFGVQYWVVTWTSSAGSTGRCDRTLRSLPLSSNAPSGAG